MSSPVTVASGISDTPSIAADAWDEIHITYIRVQESCAGSYCTIVSSVRYVQPQLIPKLPLGGSEEIIDADDPQFYKIYVPTRWGGTLTVTTDNGWVELYYPDTETKIVDAYDTISYDVEEDNHGWYYVKHGGGATSYTIGNTFVQEGGVPEDKRPWNFWYYPFQPQTNPAENLYGEGGTLDKYDGLFGTEAQKYERDHYSSGVGWAGHCWGGSVASILLPQPEIYGELDQDMMEGLVSKLANKKAYLEVLMDGVPAKDINNNPLKPVLGIDEIDEYANEFHKGLVDYLRVGVEDKQYAKVPLQSNLRDPKGINPREVWNHAIYKYSSTMKEAAEGKEDIIKITTTIYANNDEFPSASMTDRVETYVYKLKYTSRGKIYEKFEKEESGQDWISTTSFAPLNLYYIISSPFDGKDNPHIKRGNVEQLGIDFP